MVQGHSRLNKLIDVVFKEQNLYERLSAANNLRFNSWLYYLPEARTDEFLDIVHTVVTLEVKEQKTLRILLGTPPSFRDILIGILLIVLFFQLAIACIVIAIQGGFYGAVYIVIFYIVIGAYFSLSLGLLFGSIFNKTSTVGVISGLVVILYIHGGIFAGKLGQILGNGSVLQIARLLPTYYLAEGLVSA